MKKMMKMVKGALALAVAVCGLQAVAKDVYVTCSFTGETSFTAPKTGLEYVNDSSDSKNRKQPGWYFGTTINWTEGGKDGIGATRYGSSIGNALHKLAKNGVELFSGTPSYTIKRGPRLMGTALPSMPWRTLPLRLGTVG